MEDKDIIELYFSRNEDAINQTKDKYGKACYKIAYNILFNNEDSEECVNETYLGAWNSIPPHKPDLLSAFLFKLTRRLSISRLRMNLAKKRYDCRTIPFDEIDFCVEAKSRVYDNIEVEDLTRIIESFLKKQSVNARRIFICRYFYCDSISEISERFNFSHSKVKTTLFRTREKLKHCLIEEGVFDE